ncbi:hypothetical protein [Hymenobacter perfusus]|uniref:Uncharacterized protein n=1 Tax=Hymenobacter perfusus TaxID=1236770 RepID=A0A428K7A0_9BACT|nr:hypothetical protein [Hymenobacter perfusus]RSK42295.1 hypothetical protein EI293_15350 [Hymenobacter perfusus]
MSSTIKKQLFAIVILAILNFLVSTFTAGDGRDLAGHVVEGQSEAMRGATIRTLFFGIQLISFLLGLLLALAPYKGKPYKMKVVPFSLTIAICLQSALLIMGGIKLFL